MIIDSHCHLHDEKYASDLDQVLERAKMAGVSRFVTVGCDIATTKAAAALAESMGDVYFSAGFHPHEAKDMDEKAFIELTALAKHKKCVAIGECGLDYYYKHSSADEQKKAFIDQLALAHLLSLPVIVHLRDAFADCVAILEKHRQEDIPVVIHCFSGTLDEAKAFIALGCHISISGIITFKKPGDLPAVAREVRADRLLAETDCPYLAPHPFRGQRNEPELISYTLRAIAKARGEDEEAVKVQIYENTAKFFRI